MRMSVWPGFVPDNLCSKGQTSNLYFNILIVDDDDYYY